MDTFVKSGGVWNEIKRVHVKVAGVWTEISKIFVKSAGAWVQVFNKNPVSLNITDVVDVELSPTDASAQITLNSNGSITFTGNGTTVPQTYWYEGAPIAGIGNNYWYTLNILTGTGTNVGDPDGFIYSLATSRTFGWSRGAIGITQATCQLRIWSDAAATQLVAIDEFPVSIIKDA